MVKSTRLHRRGFTLVEILIVVVILGILASIAVPQFSDATAQSRATATASVVRTVQAKVFENFAIEGEFAILIADDWFVEGALPINPLDTAQNDPVILYDTAATVAITHPADKIISDNGAFWYNATNGAFRALVPVQSTPQETLDLYNVANSASVATLSATAD